VYGLYSTPDAAQLAVQGLRAEGIGEDRITVLSSEPFEEHEFAHRDKATWMGWIAVGGGVTGLAFSTWLTRMTELAWPLKTGNMPIVAWWPNIIIMFEVTMLGAILAAVVTLLVTAGLPGRRPALYDPEIMDGKILVGVENAPDAAIIERALTVPGATVKRQE
jgi:hypothetical protein